MPEFARCLPLAVGLFGLVVERKRRPPCRLVLGVEECSVGIVRGRVITVAEQSPACLGAEVVPKPFEDVLFGERPADGGIILLTHRMEEEREPEVPERQLPIGEEGGCSAAHVTIENGLKIGGPNPAARELLAVAGLGQIGLGAEQAGRMDDGVFKGLAFKGLERVLRDEDADRPLRGQKTRGRLDGGPDHLRPARMDGVVPGGRRVVGGLSVVRHAGHRQGQGCRNTNQAAVPIRLPRSRCGQ